MRPSGFTLTELMIVLAIMAVLLVVAMPNFTRWVASSRLTSQTNELVGDISYARSESATRGARITICASTDGSTCASGATNWAKGRIVFVDTDGDGARQTSETLLRVTPALSGNTTVTLSGFPNAYIQFRTYGGLNPSTPGTFELCSSSNPEGRRIAVAATGRPLASRISCP